ncbi:MAG: hypothetical protein DRH37_03740 [Deltaproteobacteria bacterium]|nr:MAG: hypothetical protein DRH37_03740 [Deltaproteobacteria bacterium]
MYWLDPHDRCSECRAAGATSIRCDYRQVRCVSCSGMADWARKSCIQHDKRGKGALRSSKHVGAGKTGTSGKATGSARGHTSSIPIEVVGGVTAPANSGSSTSRTHRDVTRPAREKSHALGAAPAPCLTQYGPLMSMEDEDVLLGLGPSRQHSVRDPSRDPRQGGKKSPADGKSLLLSVDVDSTLSSATGAMSLNTVGVPAGGPNGAAQTLNTSTRGSFSSGLGDHGFGGSGQSGPAVTLDILMKALEKNQEKVQESVDTRLELFFNKAFSKIDEKVRSVGRKRHRDVSPDSDEDRDECIEEGDSLDGDDDTRSHASLTAGKEDRPQVLPPTPGVNASGQEPMDTHVQTCPPVTTSGAHPPGTRRETDGGLIDPNASVENRELFDQAKARIARILPDCQLRHPILEDETDLYQTSMPHRLVPAPREGPATLPMSLSVRSAYQVCNQQLRGTPGTIIPLQEVYDPAEYLESLPKDAVPLRRGGMIPLHAKLGFRKHDFPVEPHGTAIAWPQKSPSDPVAIIGQDCQNVVAGLSFLEQAMSAILTVVADAREGSTDPATSLDRVFETVDDLKDSIVRTLARTSYHAARGHCNANLHARGKAPAEKTSESARTMSWAAPAECSNIDSFRAAAAAQDTLTGRRNFFDNVMVNLQANTEKAIASGSGTSNSGGPSRSARKRQRRQGTAPEASKSAPSAAQGTPKDESKDRSAGSQASTGNKAKPKNQKRQYGGKGKPKPSAAATKGDKKSL